MSETLFGIERLGEVLPDPDGAFGVAQRQFTPPYKFCGVTKFRHRGIEAAPFCAVESSFEIDEEMVCVDSPFTGLFQNLAHCEYLVGADCVVSLFVDWAEHI